MATGIDRAPAGVGTIGSCAIHRIATSAWRRRSNAGAARSPIIPGTANPDAQVSVAGEDSPTIDSVQRGCRQ